MMWCCVRRRSAQQHMQALFRYAVSLLSWRSLDIVLPVSNVPRLLTSLWIIEKLHGPSASLLLTVNLHCAQYQLARLTTRGNLPESG
jgi:hypothetical protein